MSKYRRRPFSVFEEINMQLRVAYLPRIYTWQANRYARLVGEIMEILKEYSENELNQPLNEFYLMGYELQRNAFFTKKQTNETENDENETEE
jgi:CRISPR-associated protein Csd1